MSALSIRTYYWNNKRKVLPVTAIIALAIVGISSSATLTGSFYQDEEREIAFYDHYALVFSSLRRGLSEAIVKTVEGHVSVAKTVRLELKSTPRQGLFSREGTPIYFLSEADQKPFARALEWDLVAGRWPEPGNNEVVLTENLLRNRSLEVGARIGQTVDEEDWLNGEWLIVGSFGATEVIGGIGNLDFLQEHYLDLPGLSDTLQIQPQVLAVAPIPGKEAGMEAVLDSLPKDEVFVVHRSRARRNFASLTANIDTILWILNAVTIAVIALALGLLNVIFFMQRANEFGLLAAIGYTKMVLMRRVFLEAATTVAVGWISGILLSIGIYAGLNSFIFVPRGLDELSVLTIRVVLFTVPVPITVTLFSLAIVMWQLHRMDPVAIIERRD